jgi:hypothetical protein
VESSSECGNELSCSIKSWETIKLVLMNIWVPENAGKLSNDISIGGLRLVFSS